MLVQSLYKAKKVNLLCLISFLFLLFCTSEVWSFDLGDQTAIVEAYLRTNPEDLALAKSLADQARARVHAASARKSQNANTGPFVKLWCDSAAIAPNPENLMECANFRLKAVDQMSNPQPSKKVVRIKRARESLIMIRAALEIAGGDKSVSDGLRDRLRISAECLRALISGANMSKDCN
jgi:hypothetical protein